MKTPPQFIPYSRQTIDTNDIKSIVSVLESDYITQGPSVLKFEKGLAEICGAKYAVAFSSGTAALHGAYFAAGIGRDDEIITSPLTFAATTNAALFLGARPVFCDIDEETGLIDVAKIARHITKRTRAIVPVDYAGAPPNLEKIKALARKHKCLVIEDAAHSLGATYHEKSVGGITEMTMFSFHPVKSITTGEGGAIVTNSRRFYERLLLFRNHGITKDKAKFKRKRQGEWYYEMQELGFNYRLTDIQAALGISQLKKLPRFIAARRALARRYTQKLSGIKNLILPKEAPSASSAWHLYVVRFKDSRTRAYVFDEFRKHGIGVQVHYIPVYHHPYYERLGFKKGLCPTSERFSDTCLSLPLFPTLSHSDQDRVIGILKKLLQ